jgi:hypothetical protein
MQAPASSGGYGGGGNPYRQQQPAPFVKNVQNMQPVMQPPPPPYDPNPVVQVVGVQPLPHSHGGPGMPPPQAVPVPQVYAAQPMVMQQQPIEHPMLHMKTVMPPQQQQMGTRVAGQRTQKQMDRDAKRSSVLGCCCCLLCGC